MTTELSAPGPGESENLPKIATTIEFLPSLPEGCARVVHLTHEQAAQEILRTGLNYEGYGMLSSTARAWTDPSQIQWLSDDARFRGPHIRAVVMDLPFAELRLHEDVAQSPGLVPPERIVGIIDPNEARGS